MKYLIVGLFFLASNAVSAQSANPYGMFRGNLAHSAIYPSSEVSKKAALKWKFKTGGYINSSAAIEGDKLFFGSGDGYLYCLATQDGDLIWKFKTGGPVYSSPSVVNGEVFFGSHDGNFYALNSKDGGLKWEFKTGGEKQYAAMGIHGWLPKDSLFTDLWDFWLSSPAVQNNTVYFGSGDGNFYALDTKTGRQKWKFKTNGIIHSSPAIAFGNVYFGGWDTYMHALDAATGKEKWKFKTGEDTVIFNQTGITGSPLINGNMLYFGCRDAHLYALDALTGKLVWKKFNDRGWISVTPVVYGDKLMYTSGSSQRFVELNKLTGDSIYQGKTSAFFSSPAIAGKTMYAGDFNGFMEARDISTGKQIWKYQLPSSVADSLHILNADQSINQEAFEKVIKKFDGIKRAVELRFSLGSILSSPVVKNSVIYFGSTDGYFYALQ